MDYTAENLEKAVTLFYRSEAGQQAEAHQWLTEAQNSQQAWSFVWELLSPHRSSEVQFFAATTLHTKLMKHWVEVPSDHYELLKKRILEAIISYAMGPKIVLNRLCITLSAFIIHTIPTHWPNAFEELVSSFQPQHLPNVDPERVIWILLEILTVIPEEFQSTALGMSRRNSVRIVLQEVSKDILKVVEMCLMPIPSSGFDISNLTTYLNASRCASAWIQLGGLNIVDCANVINLLIDLTCFVYWNNSDPEALLGEETELSEVTVEALNAVMQHPQTHKYRNHVTKYGAQMLYKFEKILDAECSGVDLNKDIVANLYGLIVSTADTHSKILIENLKSQDQELQKVSYDFLDSVLKCTNLPGLYPVDETSSTFTFAFWYTLQDDVLSFDTADCAQLMLLIKPYYRNLVCIMLRKSMFPLVEDQTWSLDDKEVFRCYRQDIADTFLYCFNMLNIEMLDILHGKLLEALKKDSNMMVQWNQVETCLHAFGAVAESVDDEHLYLPKLMFTIKEIPFNELPIKVLATALETIGSYSDWFADHPDQLANVFPLVISSLGTPEVATSATIALKDIAQDCQKFIYPYSEHILVAAQSALLGGALKLAECKRLMFSIGRVLSVLNVDRVMEHLNVILAPSFEEMQKLVSADPSPSVSTSLSTRLKLLSSLFSSLFIEPQDQQQIDQPILLVMQNTMPLYRVIVEKYCSNGEIMEDLSIVLKHVVSTLQDKSKPLIGDLLQLVVRAYQDYPQPYVLVIAKLVMILFGRDQEFEALNQQLLHEIINTTMQMCAQLSVTGSLSEKSDVLDEFFSMLAALCKKTPNLVFSSTVNTCSLFQCATLCLTLPEVHTLNAVTSFLVQFIAQSRLVNQVDVVQSNGEALVLRILVNLGTSAPRSTIEIYSDILLQLNKKYSDDLSRWLTMLLTQDGFPSPKITAQQKEQFIKAVLRERFFKKKLCDPVLEFVLICRGILKVDPSLP